jgi:hypothetical protein
MTKPKHKKKPARGERRIVKFMPIIEPDQIVRPPRIPRMETLASCRAVLRNILRSMAKGEIPSQLGARLAYVANLVATITKQEMEIRELTQLREQLAQLQNGGAPLHARQLLHGEVITQEPE